MSTFPQDINAAIGRYQEFVRVGERRALEAEHKFAVSTGESLYRKAARWLNARWASLEQRLHVPGTATVVSEQAAR